jgi:hypothetical protein
MMKFQIGGTIERLTIQIQAAMEERTRVDQEPEMPVMQAPIPGAEALPAAIRTLPAELVVIPVVELIVPGLPMGARMKMR